MKDWLIERIEKAPYLWLFLDYDGTLAEFAPTPDHILPDPALIDSIACLSSFPNLQVTILSGRRLSHIEKLVPLAGVMLAGSYGLEIRLPNGNKIERLDFGENRKAIKGIKPIWEALLADQEGFYLEDKGWTLAIHARFGAQELTEIILNKARLEAAQRMNTLDFILLGGHKFLEIAPRLGNKYDTVKYLLKEHSQSVSSLLIYLGDDDKDEAAFKAIHEHNGITCVVSKEPGTSNADFRLSSPAETRKWLKQLCLWLSENRIN